MKYLIYIISFLFICNINTSLASNNKIVIEDDLTDKDSKNQIPLLKHDIEEGTDAREEKLARIFEPLHQLHCD